MSLPCHLCTKQGLILSEQSSGFHRVSSDCRPLPPGASLAVCPHCRTVQVVADNTWRKEIEEIYKNYTIYYQSQGKEQQVFDTGSSAGLARSEKILRQLGTQLHLPDTGRLLDIGCGNGSFLSAFNRLHPGWKLAGLEYDAKYRAVTEAIPQVEKLFTGSLESQMNELGFFDFISLIHVLEHIENPLPFLKSVKALLKPGGMLLIELPYYAHNPFELLIADHATHFDPESISRLLKACPLKIEGIHDHWIHKELTIVATNKPAESTEQSHPEIPDLDACLSWLQSVLFQAADVARKSPSFGIFGTSIAGTWLHQELKGSTSFFVDEDAGRSGTTHWGLPVLHPQDIPQESSIYVALPHTLSSAVAQRLGREGVQYHVTPELQFLFRP